MKPPQEADRAQRGKQGEAAGGLNESLPGGEDVVRADLRQEPPLQLFDQWAWAALRRHKLLADLVLPNRLVLHFVYDWSTHGLHLVYMQEPRQMTVKTPAIATGIVYQHKQPKAEHSATGLWLQTVAQFHCHFCYGTDC